MPALGLFLLTLTDDNNKNMVIVLLCFIVGANGFHFSGVTCNHMDISPRFAGSLMACTNTAANTMGFVAPLIVGKIIDVSNFIFLCARYR